MIRKSTGLRSWEAAQKLVREWEANPQATLTLKEATEKYLLDAKARNLSEPTLKKLKNVVSELDNEFGALAIRSVTVDDIRKLRAGWKLSPLTTQKRLELMRSFFRFCVDSGWIERNPAKAVRLPVVSQEPTLPFTDAEMEKILWAADTVREIHPQLKEGTEKKLRALILLMRYSGIRISDAIRFSRERIKDGKLFLYQAKTKEPVFVPITKEVVDALKEIDEGNPLYFWNGISKPKTCITTWQEHLKKVFVIAGVYREESHNQSHRFRDTFAVSLLEKGVDLRIVSILLGHRSIKTTEKHYAPWVKALQIKLEDAVKAALK